MTDQTHADALDELARLRAQRERLIDAKDAHPELDHHRHTDTLASFDRHIGRLEHLCAHPDYFNVAVDITRAHAELMRTSNVHYMRGEHDRSL